MGTGAAEGIPAIGCHCDHCTRARREGGKLARQRTAFLISLPDYELLLESPPDIRNMIIAHNIGRIDGMFLSHAHYDHVGGLSEFFYWPEDIDLFAENGVYEDLVQIVGRKMLKTIAFHCPFQPGTPVHFSQFSFVPFAVEHSMPCYGLAFYENERRIVYASDTGPRLSNYARNLIAGADALIVNVPQFEPFHKNHLTVLEAIASKKELDVQNLILTHINHHNRPHDELENYVSQFPGVTVAYDGLTLSL